MNNVKEDLILGAKKLTDKSVRNEMEIFMSINNIQPENVRKIDLSSNELVNLNNDNISFDKFTKLLRLKLNENHLISINKEIFVNLKRLTHLVLDQNHLNSIDVELFKYLGSFLKSFLKFVFFFKFKYNFNISR
jgi:Leucine-rich repeat (LRR) protein